jgi:leader peptidase (prepilin peptidase)/N-methyltransferase
MEHSAFGFAIVCIFGLFIGSFVNVCIYRIPRRESVLWPASHCPSCRKAIAIYDNIPIVSYLFLKGRCRACRVAISRRYPLVELLNGAGYGVSLWWFGWDWSTVVYMFLFSVLLVVTFIDLSHQIVPDVITLPGIPLGMLCAATILPVGILNSVMGILIGGGLLWGLAWISPYIFGKEGMGGGDIKLMAMIGAFLGWKPTLLAIMMGALIGSVIGIALIALKMLRRDQYVPFGPFLSLGSVLAMFFHHEIITWYFHLLGVDS